MRNALKSLTESRPAPDAAERGSALIIVLMIMIILTLVGVTFLLISEQEERISVTERDHAQTLYLAEAGVEVAKNWFNDPAPPPGNPIKPDVTQMNLTLRRGAVFKDANTNLLERTAPPSDPEVDASTGNLYTGGQSIGIGSTPFEKPFRGENRVTLWGRRDTPDVVICSPADLDVDGDGTADCSDQQRAYLDALNASLLVAPSLRTDGHVPRDLGTFAIEQIRVYRPPLDYDLKVRYGIATIEAVAVKRITGRKVTERVVREVLQEIPFPGPAGAIETEGEVTSSGSQGVHWGQVVSSSRTGDNIDLPGDNNNFPHASMPRETGQRWGYHYTINPASFHDVNGPAGVTATALSELLATTVNGSAAGGGATAPYVADSWLLFRARNQVTIGGNPNPAGDQKYPFGTNLIINPPGNEEYIEAGEVNHLSDSGRSHLFQNQTVRFPPIDYATWKQVAQSGQKGMHYMVWDNGDEYTDNGVGTVRPWTEWINANPAAANALGEAGVYFFDTQDEMDPEEGGTLTPEHDWVNDTYAEGFIYVNSSVVDTSAGTSDVTVAAKQPGEPFLDDGIDLHLPPPAETVGDNCICIRWDPDDGCVLGLRPIGYVDADEDCGPTVDPTATTYRIDSCLCPPSVLTAMSPSVAMAEADTFRNGIWDVDLDNDGQTDGQTNFAAVTGWATFIGDNASGVGSGHGFAAGNLPHYEPARQTDQGRQADDWKRDPRYANDAAFFPTRQPHEAFLNLKYQDDGSGGIPNWGNASNPPPADIGVYVDYQASGDIVEDGIVTTRARDNTGAAMYIDDIGINGVLYNHGTIDMTGNLRIYGSLAVRGGFSGSGSVDIWFNEDLVKGLFPPVEWNLPRVYASARETD